jgi:hypothetical protein
MTCVYNRTVIVSITLEDAEREAWSIVGGAKPAVARCSQALADWLA